MKKHLEYLKIMSKLKGFEISSEDYEQIDNDYSNFIKKTEGIEKGIDYYHNTYKNFRLIFSHSNKNKNKIEIYLAKDIGEQKPHYKINHHIFFFLPTKIEMNVMAKLIGYKYHNEETGFNNIAEVKKHILQNKNIPDLKLDDLKLLFWLLDEKPRLVKDFKHDYLKKIILVIEKDNKRYYITAPENYNNQLDVGIATLKDEKFNYIDEGRLIYDDIYFDEIDIKDLDKELVRYISSHATGFTVINNQKLNLFKKRKEEEDALKKAKDNYNEVLMSRLKQGITYNNVKFSDHFIECQDFKMGSSSFEITGFIEQYVDFEKEIDVNILYENFCVFVANLFCSNYDKNKMEIFLGKYSVRLWKETKTIEDKNRPNKVNKSTRYLVESIRINKSEIADVLKRVLCFPSRIEFVFFLKSISKCSIKIHKYLSNGVKISFYEDNETKFLKLNLVRKKGINYVKMADKLFKVKNSNSLFTKEKYPQHMEAIIEFFIEFFEISADDVFALIKNGMKEYEAIIKRSEQFLKNALIQVNAKEAREEKDNTIYEGYLIEGKLDTYFVDKKDMRIYRYPSFKHICIVDSNIDSEIKNDRIAARILALANDKFLTEQIHTLRT